MGLLKLIRISGVCISAQSERTGPVVPGNSSNSSEILIINKDAVDYIFLRYTRSYLCGVQHIKLIEM